MALTLLELNAFAHAICALLVYVLWWNKPQDIGEPIPLSGPRVPEMAGYLLMHSEFGLKKRGLHWICRPSEAAYGLACHLTPYSPERGPELAEAARRQRRQPVLDGGHWRLYFGENFYGYCLANEVEYELRDPDGDHDKVKSTFLLDDGSLRSEVFAHVDLASWEIEVLHLADLARETWNLKAGDSTLQTTGALSACISNRSALSDDDDNQGSNSFVGFSLASTCYGLLHALAWTAPFRNAVEAHLWKISAIALSATGPLAVLRLISKSVVPGFKSFRSLCEKIIFLILCVYGLLHILARLDLVVQSFMGFAYLPPSALLVPQWSQYVPHID